MISAVTVLKRVLLAFARNAVKRIKRMSAYLISVTYVFMVLAVCVVLGKFFSQFYVRKVMHILMASWWFIRLQFPDCEFLWTGPIVCAIIIFFLRHKYNFKIGMGLFCLSLALMTVFSYYFRTFVPYATASVLILGYSDSLAAIVGYTYQLKKNINGNRTFIGSCVFFIVSLIILIILFINKINILLLILIALISAFAEAFVFPEYDNFFVPLIVFDLLIIIKII